MKRYLLALAVLISSYLRAESPAVISVDDATQQNLLVYHLAPEYPYEARRRGITGSGIFELRFDYATGRLREVHVVKSTRQPILDAAVISSLKRWQARPYSVHAISVPVTFTMGHRQW